MKKSEDKEKWKSGTEEGGGVAEEQSADPDPVGVTAETNS